MNKWLVLVVFCLSVLGLIVWGSGRFIRRSELGNFSQLSLKNTQSPKIYLSGPYRLVPSSVVLGWETEEIKPSDIIRMVNVERQKVDSPPLRENPELTKAAEMRVGTIFKNQNFSHEDPIDGIQLSTVLPRVNYSFSYASENIGLAQDEATGIVHGFMSSPPHRQNMLDPKLVETGVAVRKGQFKGNYVAIVVQLFGIPTPKEVYLGYSETDKTTVRGLIEGVDGQLSRTEGFLVKDPGSQYYKGWEEVLNRQKSRLSEIYGRMLSGLPFEKQHYELVAAYNAGWKDAPK